MREKSRRNTDACRKQRAMSCLWPRLISNTTPPTGILTTKKFRTQLFFPMMHTHWPAAADSLLHCQQLETQEENKQDLVLRARRDAICLQGKQPAWNSCGVLAPTFAALSDNRETAARSSCSVGTTGRRDVHHPPPAAPSHILLSACADAVSRRAFSDSVLVNVSTHFFCCWSPTRSSVLLYSAPPGGVTGILLCSVEINYVRTSEANTRRAFLSNDTNRPLMMLIMGNDFVRTGFLCCYGSRTGCKVTAGPRVTPYWRFLFCIRRPRRVNWSPCVDETDACWSVWKPKA